MKNDNLKRNDTQPPVISGDFVPTQSVIAVTQLTVTGPYRGDFQIIDQGRLIVGEDPDIGPRGILSAQALRGYNFNGLNTFAVWFATTEGHAPGDFHAGNLAGNFLQYNQTDGTLGLYTPDGAGVIMDNDGTFIAGHQEHGHMKWDAVSASLKIMSGTETMAEISDDGNAQFTGVITAQGGRITGRMMVDDVLHVGDVDGPAVYVGRFERMNDAGEIVESSEILATDAANLPWFHVVAGGDTAGGGYFHLGGTGNYSDNLSFDGTNVVLSGALIWAGGKGVADATGISHTESADTYWRVSPNSELFMELNSSGSLNYNTLRVMEDTGIAGYFSGGAIGVFARSTTEQVGIWGFTLPTEETPGGSVPDIDALDPDRTDGIEALGAGTSIYGLTFGATAGRFIASGGGRGLVGSTDDAAQAGITARNTGGGAALTCETSYAYLQAGLIVNALGGATGIYDTRIAGDTDEYLVFVDASADKVGISEASPNATLDVNGTTRLGDSDTNYLSVSATGNLTLVGSAKYERHVQIPVTHTGAVDNQPTPVDVFTAGGDQYPTTGAKYGFCQWEIPDDWDGTDVYFEIDWLPDSGAISGTDAIRWTVEYRSIAEGELINNGTSVTLDNGAGGDTGDYAQYQTKHTRVTLAYNDANQPLTAQDHVYFKVSRDTGVANNFGGSVVVTAYEVIYTSAGFPTSN